MAFISLVIIDLATGERSVVEIEENKYINFGYTWAGAEHLVYFFDFHPQDCTVLELYEVKW